MNFKHYITLLLFIGLVQPIFGNTYDSLIREIHLIDNQDKFSQWFGSISNKADINLYQKISLCDELIEVCHNKEFYYEEAVFKYNKSVFLTIIGNYTYALQLINEVMPVFEENMTNHLAASYNTAGGVLATLGDSALGIQYLEKAIAITNDSIYTIDQKETAINNYLVLGTIYYNYKNLQKAKENYNIAEQLCLKSLKKTSKEYISTQLNLSNVEADEKKYNEAIARCKMALFYTEKNNYEDVKGAAYLNLSAYYIKQGLKDSALYYLNLCEQTGDSNGLIKLKAAVLKFRSLLYKKTGDYKMAYDELLKLKSVQKEIEKESSSAMANYLLALEKKAADEKLNKIKHKEKIKQNNLWIALISFFAITILALILIISWWQKRKLKQNLKEEKSNSILIKSQLSAIRSQMNPHFIFNALNSIQYLVLKQEKNKAYEYIEKFAHLIRQVLHFSEKEKIEIEEEINMLNLYLQLEKQRFNEDFSFEIKTNDLEDVNIPPMLIQPFVENAIKHGLLHQDGEKRLTICLELEESILSCTIEDNGIGRVEAEKISARQKKKYKSFSIAGTTNRIKILQTQFKKDFQLKIEDLYDVNGQACGTKVHMEIPCERMY